MKTKGKMFLKEWGISVLTVALAISIFVGSAVYLKPYLANATETTSEGIEIITTNNSNIKFSTYFVNENGEKVDTLNSEIDENAYLYVDVTVLNEGYFNGTITLNNSNFVFVEKVEENDEASEETESEEQENNEDEENDETSEISDETDETSNETETVEAEVVETETEETTETEVEVNKGVSDITENSFTLDKINAGETVTVKVAIKAVVEDTITLSNLSTETEVALGGEYVNSKNIEKNKSEEITGKSTVKLQWITPEDAEAKLKAELLTNSIYEINGEEKRVVQIIVNSKISSNCYPVYTSSIKLAVPENVENISVSARSTDNTNSNIEFGSENYTYNDEDKTVEITLENKDTENISWNKNSLDTIVVTYVFDVNEYVEEKSIDVNSVITTYDSKELTASTNVKLEQTESIEGIITYEISSDASIYKGKLYTGEDKEYSVTNKINVNYLNVIDTITLNCNEATYLAGTQEGSANILYTATKINKQEFLNIFGEDGTLKITDENGNEVTITKDTEADEDGNITISYEEETKSIEITTSEPKATGTLNIEHSKKILNTGYTRTTIDAMTEIKETITGYAEEKETGEVDEAKEETTIKLEETTSSASLKMDTSSISTTAENQTITLCAILDSSDETKNLYKNPVVRITLPEEITVISAQYAVLYKNGLSVGDKSIKENENGQYVITIQLDGEQTSYDSAGGTRIYFKLEISTSTLTPTKLDTIQMAYTNEYTGEVKATNAEISFESQYGLMIYNQLTNYSEDGEKLVTIDKETATASIEEYSESKEVNVGTAIINNYGTEITDVSIIGSVPSGDNSTFVASLNSVVTDNADAQILYSTKTDIDADDESWGEYTEDSVSYKIVIASIAAEEVVKLNVTSTIPAELGYNEEGYYTTTTVCTYNEKKEANTSTMLLATEVSDVILKKSTTTSGLDVEIAAYLGDTSISEDDTVYEGETIRYEVTVTNNTGTDYTNVTISAEQTNGYMWDDITKPMYNYYLDQNDEDPYYDEDYYEVTDYCEKEITTMEEFYNGVVYSFEYESSTFLLINEEIDGTETYGTISIISEDQTLNENTETIKNEIVDAELQVSLVNDWSSDYEISKDEGIGTYLNITNISENEMDNLSIQFILSEKLNPDWSIGSEQLDQIEYIGQETTDENTTLLNFEIKKIAVGETCTIYISPYLEEIDGEQENIWILANVMTEGNIKYTSNKLSRTIYNDTHDVNLNQQCINGNGNVINVEEDYLIDGEQIEFTATVTNKEEEEVVLNVYYSIDSKIDITNIEIITEEGTDDWIEYVNDNYDEDDRDYAYRNINKTFQTLSSGKTVEIIVKGKINAWETESITNTLSTFDYGNYDNSSNEYTVKVETVKEEIDNNEDDEEDDEIITEDDYSDDNEEDDDNDSETDEEDDNDSETDEEDNNDEEDYNDSENDEEDGDNDEEDDNDSENDEEDDNSNEESNNDENTENDTNYEYEDNQNTESYESNEEMVTYTVSGIAWLDSDKDGIRDSSEERISDLEVLAINSSSKSTIGTTLTNSNGEYELTLEEGEYIIVFLYDNSLYTTTTYQASSDSSTNSDALEESIEINGENQTAGVTDTVSVKGNVTNIDIGIITKETFDLNISKYVNKITISNESGTKEYNQSEGTTLAKAEIKSKYINGSTVEIEYTIQVTNIGDVAGYANTIVDDMPSDLDFDETLNSGWYLEYGQLYNTSLANEKIEPGETKELTLILTKQMTESNIGLINNNAEIESSSSESGTEDETENIAQANVIISLSTGAVTYAIGTFIVIAIIGACAFVINKKILHKRI